MIEIYNSIFLQLMSILLVFLAFLWGIAYAIKIAKSN